MVCTIIGTGNSLRNFDFSKTKGDIFVINEAYKFVDFHRLFAYDLDFVVKVWKDFISKGIDTNFINTIFDFYPKLEDFNNITFWNRALTNKELTRCKYTVSSFNSSACFAINAAFNLGYKEIYLLGIDNKLDNDIVHFYDDKKASKQMIETYENAFKMFDVFFNIIAKSLNFDERIISVQSSIECFEKMTMNEYLESFE